LHNYTFYNALPSANKDNAVIAQVNDNFADTAYVFLPNNPTATPSSQTGTMVTFDGQTNTYTTTATGLTRDVYINKVTQIAETNDIRLMYQDSTGKSVSSDTVSSGDFSSTDVKLYLRSEMGLTKDRYDIKPGGIFPVSSVENPALEVSYETRDPYLVEKYWIENQWVEVGQIKKETDGLEYQLIDDGKWVATQTMIEGQPVDNSVIESAQLNNQPITVNGVQYYPRGDNIYQTSSGEYLGLVNGQFEKKDSAEPLESFTTRITATNNAIAAATAPTTSTTTTTTVKAPTLEQFTTDNIKYPLNSYIQLDTDGDGKADTWYFKRSTDGYLQKYDSATGTYNDVKNTYSLTVKDPTGATKTITVEAVTLAEAQKLVPSGWQTTASSIVPKDVTASSITSGGVWTASTLGDTANTPVVKKGDETRFVPAGMTADEYAEELNNQAKILNDYNTWLAKNNYQSTIQTKEIFRDTYTGASAELVSKALDLKATQQTEQTTKPYTIIPLPAGSKYKGQDVSYAYVYNGKTYYSNSNTEFPKDLQDAIAINPMNYQTFNNFVSDANAGQKYYVDSSGYVHVNDATGKIVAQVSANEAGTYQIDTTGTTSSRLAPITGTPSRQQLIDAGYITQHTAPDSVIIGNIKYTFNPDGSFKSKETVQTLTLSSQSGSTNAQQAFFELGSFVNTKQKGITELPSTKQGEKIFVDTENNMIYTTDSNNKVLTLSKITPPPDGKWQQTLRIDSQSVKIWWTGDGTYTDGTYTYSGVNAQTNTFSRQGALTKDITTKETYEKGKLTGAEIREGGNTMVIEKEFLDTYQKIKKNIAENGKSTIERSGSDFIMTLNDENGNPKLIAELTEGGKKMTEKSDFVDNDPEKFKTLHEVDKTGQTITDKIQEFNYVYLDPETGEQLSEQDAKKKNLEKQQIEITYRVTEKNTGGDIVSITTRSYAIRDGIRTYEQFTYDTNGKLIAYEYGEADKPGEGKMNKLGGGKVVNGKLQNVTDQKTLLRFNQFTSKQWFSDLEFKFTQYKGLSGWSQFIFRDEDLANWRENVDKFFSTFYLGTDYWVSKICAKYIPKSHDAVLTMRTSDGLYDLVAHAEGERTDIHLPDGTSEYLYKLTISVQNPEYSGYDSLEFNVRLEGASTVRLYQNWIKLDEDESFTAGGGKIEDGHVTYDQTHRKPIVQYSKNYYDKICIDFSPSIITAKGDKEDHICNSIVAYTGDATSYEQRVTSGGATGTPVSSDPYQEVKI
jgi:hypothetical protein